MDSADMPSEEKLEELLREGRISVQEFDVLRETLKGTRKERKRVSVRAYLAGRPWQIWVVVAVLGLEGVFNLLAIPQMWVQAVWFMAKCLFIYGLLQGWKWVFVLFMILAGIHVVYFAVPAPVGALMNLGLLLLTLWAWRFYFPKKATDAPDAMERPRR